MTNVLGEPGNYQRSVSLPAALYIAICPYCLCAPSRHIMVQGDITAEISIYVHATICEKFPFAYHVLRRHHLLALLETGAHYGQVFQIRMSQSLSSVSISIMYNQKCWSALAPSGLRGAVQPAVTASLYQLVFGD